MEFLVYILHSATLDKYYIGFTADDINERLRKHNTNHKGFTGGYGDWKVAFTQAFNSKEEALKREKQLKKWKSKIRIAQLVQTLPTS